MGKMRSLQENWRSQGKISCKDGHDKGQEQLGPNTSRRDLEEMARIQRGAIIFFFFFLSLNDMDNHNAVVTLLEPGILECEVKWDLGSITMNKASRGDRIPAEFFEILKDNSVKVHSVKVKEVAQSCLILCDPMDCSLPGSSVHGIFQERVLEWATISFSRESSQPRDLTRVSRTAGRRFTV